MKTKTRLYQKPSDLQAIGNLLRQSYQQDPHWNSWSFALYDIWAQRKLGDQQVFGKTDWQLDVRLWEMDEIGLVGAAVFRDPAFVKLVVLPDHRDLMIPMLDWVETHFIQKEMADKQLTIETIESNPFFEQLLGVRGYEKDAGYYIFREKDLVETSNEPVVLPTGFQIKHIETPEDLKQFHRGTELVFSFCDNRNVYQILRQAPSFVPELDVIILSPTGEIASFGSAWFDKDLGLAEFEPVGTVSKFRKIGLGSALIAETCNRLRGLGCRKTTVMSWSESKGANKLYRGAGFLPRGKKNYWQWMN
jgi:GNAT superfamily N-acetyltransferase